MKQKQYAPMTVAEMGVVLFAANEGFLADVPVNKVLDFEGALLSYMKTSHGDFMDQINREGKYTDEVIDTMRSALESFVATQTF